MASQERSNSALKEGKSLLIDSLVSHDRLNQLAMWEICKRGKCSSCKRKKCLIRVKDFLKSSARGTRLLHSLANTPSFIEPCKNNYIKTQYSLLTSALLVPPSVDPENSPPMVAPIIADLSIGPRVSPQGFAGHPGVQTRIEEGLLVWCNYIGAVCQPPTNLPPLIPPQVTPQLPPQVPTMFPPVDHAERGDENQPHTSAHNSTSTVNQDVVAAQLAAMQQQFDVFQLVLAQLLARNNHGDPLINLLNLAQQPPAPQQNPQPVQHAPAISESQGQSHIAPTQQPLPYDVTRRLDSLEKLAAEHRGAPPPHHAADFIPHPLNTNITLEPYPAGFKIPQLETYDGTKDPDDHLHAFYSCMQA
ncbi:hypothetical protein SLEP1_g18003 [Rubroshorea leprosula]|uniref:Uncharacterized protein n=1 Tax=Rubroshorea leprosula TaxID=152421 RepID=A0AAV5J519_9ROSI|nr:hypothetical protein SLEP1_g18003 [Rubroshorea leprosula]